MERIEQYLSTAYVATMMLCSPTTVVRWIKAGKLKAVRVGKRGRYRIPMSALEALTMQPIGAGEGR
ncbi:MAG: helix-turn-helix domain-containing protein [Deltaproteobacteria bacterium]|nr:helix-turn-helix domain-containing protein [Deltaproteobacteria bacterium]